jgi:uncharacterized alkaline shock family protein YloU
MSSPQTVEAAPNADGRGRLEVRPRAVQRIAEQATVDVTGWTDRSGGLGKALGRKLPSVDVTVTGRHIVVAIEVAAPWGHVLAGFATSVRDRVGARVGELTGLTVDRVEVRIVQIDREPRAAGRVK